MESLTLVKHFLPIARTTFALVISIVLVFPIYWMVVTSLLPSSVVLSRDPPLIPLLSDLDLAPYEKVLVNGNFVRWFANSSFVTAGAVVLSLVVASLGGYSLSRFSSRTLSGMGYVLLLTRLLPGTLLVIPLFVLFSRLGLLSNLAGLVIADTTAIVPFSVWMMKSFFDSIPFELEEAAQVDGCSRLGAIRRVLLPLAAPGLAATAIYSAIIGWSDYVFARTLMVDPNNWTITVGTTSFIGEHAIDWSALMAAGVLSLIPIAIVFLFLEPFLVSGLVGGAVKA